MSAAPAERPTWMPIEKLFDQFPMLLDRDHAHKKRVIEHHLGPELKGDILERIVAYVREGSAKGLELEWLIGCHVMRVYPADRRSDFGWDQLKDDRVERVVQLLLQAPSLT